MREWVRRLGRVSLAGVEVGLASLLLLTVAALDDVRTGVASGAYDPEAASGFAIGFLLLWAVTGFRLLLLLTGHAAVWILLTADRGGPDEVRPGATRVVAELLVAVAILLLATDGDVPADGYEFLLDTSVVAALTVFVHVVLNVVRSVREAVGAR